uniref:Uncharacterized protein n=1 Tax=Arundo donax TaxID=35708 RepID=A0A0A9BL35_ARUDO
MSMVQLWPPACYDVLWSERAVPWPSSC